MTLLLNKIRSNQQQCLRFVDHMDLGLKNTNPLISMTLLFPLKKWEIKQSETNLKKLKQKQ